MFQFVNDNLDKSFLYFLICFLWEREDSNLRTLMRTDLQSVAIATMRRSQIRKGEDGSVDISFYDWHYFGVFLQTPMIPTEIHSHVIGITIPQSTYKNDKRMSQPSPSLI